MAYTSKYTGSKIESKLDEVFQSKLQEKTVEITDNGVTEVSVDEGYFALSKVSVSVNVPSNEGNSWTGHADVEGLKAIGWDDEDIAFYQKYGVRWDEEEDEDHKVSEDNKSLYGVLTVDNIQTYKDRIVYLPKIDFSSVTSGRDKFANCPHLIAIPKINTSNMTTTQGMFYYCSSILCIPPLDISSSTNTDGMFWNCMSLEHIEIRTSNKIIDVDNMFYTCRRLISCSEIDMTNVVTYSGMFYSADMLYTVKLKNVSVNLALKSFFLSKSSLLYIINNEAAISAITITLHSAAYQRLAEDADILAALNNHPNVNLASV